MNPKLGAMFHGRVVPVVGVVVWTFMAAACSRQDAPRAVESAGATTTAIASTSSRRTDWSGELGQVLLVPSDSDDAAVVLYPDEPSVTQVAARRATLVNASGDTASINLVSVDTQQCGDASMVRLGTAVATPWAVGFLGQTGAILRMDSIESLPSPDSARLAADLARLASALPTHRDSRFSGLPFAVLDAHRFTSDGHQFLVAHLARRLNQEAAPLEERTMLVAERASAGESWSASYSERSEGSEDTAQHFELLSAIRGKSAILLVVARDDERSTEYEVLERDASGRWRVRWSRRLAC